jgi:hypothetical protein
MDKAHRVHGALGRQAHVSRPLTTGLARNAPTPGRHDATRRDPGPRRAQAQRVSDSADRGGRHGRIERRGRDVCLLPPRRAGSGAVRRGPPPAPAGRPRGRPHDRTADLGRPMAPHPSVRPPDCREMGARQPSGLLASARDARVHVRPHLLRRAHDHERTYVLPVGP